MCEYYTAAYKLKPTYINQHFLLIGKFELFLLVIAGIRRQRDEIKHIMQIDNLWLSVGAHLQPKAALIVKASEGAGVGNNLKSSLATVAVTVLQIWQHLRKAAKS